MPGSVPTFLRRQPWRALGLVVAVWAALAGLNLTLQHYGIHTEVPDSFPISIFSGPTIHLDGIPYVAAFLVVLAGALWRARPLGEWEAFVVGLVLVCLGNLGQGGWDEGFLSPFYLEPFQYYHDALRVGDWRSWLADFNHRQPGLKMHGRTHPPFAVLLHVALMRAPGGGLPLLAAGLVVLSCLSISLVWRTLRVLGVPAHERGLLALLFSVLPAVNVYAAASLDGVVMTCATIWLFGLVRLRSGYGARGVSLALMAAGLVLTNLLTYGGVFLVAAGGLAGLYDRWKGRGRGVLDATVVAVAVFAAVALLLFLVFGYDHVAGFRMASYLENPRGFRGFEEPVVYAMTRLEGVAEIGLFFSIACTATLLRGRGLREDAPDRVDHALPVMMAGTATLLLMLAAGAWRTGETARACMFIYPYLLLAFSGLGRQRVTDLCILAGAQTAAMQLLGDYYW